MKWLKNSNSSQTQEKPANQAPTKPKESTIIQSEFQSQLAVSSDQSDASKVFKPRSFGEDTSTPATKPATPSKPVKSSKMFRPKSATEVPVDAETLVEVAKGAGVEVKKSRTKERLIFLIVAVVTVTIIGVMFMMKDRGTGQTVNPPTDTLPPILEDPMDLPTPSPDPSGEESEEPEEPENLEVDPVASIPGYSVYFNNVLGLRLEYPSSLYVTDLSEHYLNALRTLVEPNSSYHLASLDLSGFAEPIPLTDFHYRDVADSRFRLSLVSSIQAKQPQGSESEDGKIQSLTTAEYNEAYLDYLFQLIDYETELERVMLENEKRSKNRQLPLPVKPEKPASLTDAGKSKDVESPEGTESMESSDALSIDWGIVSEFSPSMSVYRDKGLRQVSLQLVSSFGANNLLLTYTFEPGLGVDLTNDLLQDLRNVLLSATFYDVTPSGASIVIPAEEDSGETTDNESEGELHGDTHSFDGLSGS
jgi:hypothetical protein